MRLDGSHDLLKLCKDQYEEADANVSPRLSSYAWAIDAWRGKFRYETDYYSGVDYSWFGMARAFDKATSGSVDGIPDVYVRTAFQTVETIAARFDKFFISNNKPFQVTTPKALWGVMPPDPALSGKRADCLSAFTDHAAYDYHYHKNSERMMQAVKNLLTTGTGFVMNLEGESPDPYPHAILMPLNSWDVLEDPLTPFPEDWRYCIIRQWVSVEGAVKKYKDCEKEIREATTYTDRGGRTTGSSSGAQRKEILLLHYIGWYDLSSLKDRKQDEERASQDGGKPALCRLTFAATTSGPSDVLLKAYEMDPRVKSIPIEPLTVLRDPCEQSCRGIGMPIVVKDDQEVMNALTESLILNLEFLSNPGGFYNAGMQDVADQALAGEIRPREWRPVQLMPGQNINDVLQERQVRPLLDQISGLRGEFRMEPGRKTGVGGSAEGTIESNTTGTATQDQNLRQESNEMFRYRGQRLDPSLKRIYRNHVLYTAMAIKGYEAQTAAESPDGQGAKLWYRTPEGTYEPLDTSFFDEPWEVELHSGTSALDGVEQASVLGAVMTQAAGIPGVGDQYDGIKVVDFTLAVNGIDPAQFKKSPEKLQQEMQAAEEAKAAEAEAGSEGPKVTVTGKLENLPTEAQTALLGVQAQGAVNPRTGPAGVPGGPPPPPPRNPSGRPPSGGKK